MKNVSLLFCALIAATAIGCTRSSDSPKARPAAPAPQPAPTEQKTEADQGEKKTENTLQPAKSETQNPPVPQQISENEPAKTTPETPSAPATVNPSAGQTQPVKPQQPAKPDNNGPIAASKLPFPENHQAVLEQAEKLGAPMRAVERAMKEAEGKAYSKKDVITVFDLSQTSDKKRFYMLDFKAGKTTAYHAAHGKGNGEHVRATHFRGFQQDGADMTPLGALRTGVAYTLEEYETVVDQYDGKRWSGLVVADLEGMKSYNRRFNRGDLWTIMHPKWYVTEGFRRANQGYLGRSKGCVVLDPVHSNTVFKRVQSGALLYVTVGNDPIEKYID